MLEIKAGENKFYVGDSEHSPIAQITFTHKDNTTIIADHTYVSESLRGQGIANKLFNELMDYARRENKKIIPECSYVKVKMERNKNLHDLIFQ